MKRLLIVVVGAIMVCAASAPGLLESMQAKIVSMGIVEISVNIQDSDVTVITDGAGYRMDSDVMGVWCDGTHQWIYNKSTNEMTVTNADPASVDVFENPASVLSSKILSAYSVISEQNRTVVLKAGKNIKVSYPEISIKAGADNLPVSVTLKSASGEIYDMKILSVKTVRTPSAVSFAPPEELLKKSFVNDMR